MSVHCTIKWRRKTPTKGPTKRYSFIIIIINDPNLHNSHSLTRPTTTSKRKATTTNYTFHTSDASIPFSSCDPANLASIVFFSGNHGRRSHSTTASAAMCSNSLPWDYWCWPTTMPLHPCLVLRSTTATPTTATTAPATATTPLRGERKTCGLPR